MTTLGYANSLFVGNVTLKGVSDPNDISLYRSATKTLLVSDGSNGRANIEIGNVSSTGKISTDIEEGQALLIGNTALYLYSLNPSYISLGRTIYGDGMSTEIPYSKDSLKLRLAESVAENDAYGFGITDSAINYVVTNPFNRHQLWTGNIMAANIASTGTTVPKLTSSRIDTVSGNLVLSPVNGVVSIPKPSGIVLQLGEPGNATSTNLTPQIHMGKTFYNGTATDKAAVRLMLYESVSPPVYWGIGVSNYQINYNISESHLAAFSHVFYLGSNERLRVNTNGISTTGVIANVSVTTNTINTSSGDLSLNPAGNLNFNNKTVVNVGSLTSTGTISAVNLVATSNVTTGNLILSNTSTMGNVAYQSLNTTFSTTYGESSDNGYITGYGLLGLGGDFNDPAGAAISMTGQYVIRCKGWPIGSPVTPGVYVSKDYGVTYTRPVTTSSESPAISKNGSVMYYGSMAGGLYRSVDYGVNWVVADSTVRRYNPVVCNGVGDKVVACTLNTGIYISNSYGSSLTAVDGVRNWTSVCMSSDGMKIFATVNGAPSRISDDGGVTFRDSPLNGAYTWCSMSGDGRVILVSGSNLALQLSRNGGRTFTSISSQIQPWGITCMNHDGSFIMAAYYTTDNFMKYSRDGGDTWSTHGGFAGLAGTGIMAISGNGRHSIVGTHGYLWKSNTYPIGLVNYNDVECAGSLSVSRKAYLNDVRSVDIKTANISSNYLSSVGANVQSLTSIENSTTGNLVAANIKAASSGLGTINFYGATLSNCTINTSYITNSGTGFYGLVDTPISKTTTTDNVPTIIRSYTTQTNSSTNIDAIVAGKRPATGEACNFNIKASVINNAGTTSLISPAIIDSFKTSGATNCSISVTISGNVVSLTVVGIASQTWNWVVSSTIVTSID